MAKRIQLRRSKGWRKPSGAVVVARPSRWGNPFAIADCLTAELAATEDEARALCVLAYEAWLAGDERADAGPDGPERRAAVLAELPELRDRDLACWCPLNGPCHADVLLERAAATGSTEAKAEAEAEAEGHQGS